MLIFKLKISVIKYTSLKTGLFLFIFLTLSFCIYAQQHSANYLEDSSSYKIAFTELQEMLEGIISPSFKRAVFITENTYLDNQLSEEEFNNQILILTTLAKKWMKYNPLHNYKYADSINFHKNLAIYRVLKDTIKIVFPGDEIMKTQPFTYDFNDFFGYKNWAKMFVTKLLVTHKGNCHSLPYLYKILADEIAATCWLSFAPNHIYIKNRCEKIGWYNTELTSGQFPIDAWITASGYVTLDAIRSGIYMDTLSNQQAIAQCLLDLAKGYERKTHNHTDSFIIKCCDLTLQYFPNNVAAIIYKAETLKREYESYKNDNAQLAAGIYKDMEGLYVKAIELGYREEPEKMYAEWLQSVYKEANKYSNKKIIGSLKRN